MYFAKSPLRPAFTAAIFAALLISGAHARTWISSDGSKTFEAELKSYDPATGMVAVKTAAGADMEFNQDKLSAADIAWLKQEGVKAMAKTPAPTVIANVPDSLPAPDGKEADMTKPVQVYILMGEINMFGFGTIETLKDAVETKRKYPYMVDGTGAWSVRKDVRHVFMSSLSLRRNDWMSVYRNTTVGPEQGIGHILGHITDAPVMILKSCDARASLGSDLLPPGSKPYEAGRLMVPGYRGTREDPKGNGGKPVAATYAGKQYDDDVEGAKQVLADLGTYYPGAKGYEIAGFFFWQGETDCNTTQFAERYEKNLVQLIKQLRKDFNAPGAKFVLGTLGEATEDTDGILEVITKAQLAVDGEKGRHSEFKGNVATVFTNPLSKGGTGAGRYNGNAETFMDVGEAMGRAMAKMIEK